MKPEDIKTLNQMTGAGLLDCKKALIETGGNLEEAAKYLKEKGIAKAVKKATRIAAEGLIGMASKDNKAVMVEINSETDFVAKNQLFIDFVNFSAQLALNLVDDNPELMLKQPTPEGTYQDSLVALIARIGEKISFRRVKLFKKDNNQNFGIYLHTGAKIGAIAVIDGSVEVAKDIAMQVAATNPIYLTSAAIPESVRTEEVASQLAALKNDSKFDGKPEAMLKGIAEGKMKKVLSDQILDEIAFIKDPDQTVGNYLKANQSTVKAFARFQVGEGMEKRTDDFAEEVRRQAQ